MQLTDKVALVTGGARRVGRAIVLELARAGCHVAIHYRTSKDNSAEVAAGVSQMGRKAVTIRGELTDPAEWPRIIDAAARNFGRLDILINNASSFLTDKADTLHQFDLPAWDQMFRINVTAPVALSHHAAAHLGAHGMGKIVNLCDIAADRPWAKHVAYCASKAALVAATKALAKALAPVVQVNGVSPGIAEFPESYSEELRQQLIDNVPLGRAGTPEDIAKTVRFLCESGDYITGQVIPVDGGRSLA
jgi:NAD(P)-dependent dehydrogenase (short-subunit alcohol dehydrogenase family)